MTPTEEITAVAPVDMSDGAHADLRPRWVLGAAVACGAAVDLLVRSRIDGAAGTATVVALALVLVASEEVRTSIPSRVALVLATVAGALLMVRASDWLVPLNVVAAVGLLFLAATLPSVASWRDLPLAGLALRAAEGPAAAIGATHLLRDLMGQVAPTRGDEARARTGAVLRGLALAVLPIVVLIALLASADAVFASMITGSADPSPVIGHLALGAAGVWLAGAAAWFVAHPSEPTTVTPPLRLGSTEAAIVLGGVAAVYALFVASQIVAEGASASYILETTGLTRAEYARSGFFQLLWAAGLTLVVVLGMHWLDLSDRESPVLRTLQVATIALTLSVVAVAVRRLGLYEDAYGLTMLRLYCTVFACWLGVVMITTGAYVARRWRHRWLPTAIAALALGALFGMNLVNPERIVVDRNVQRAVDGHDIDVEYLASLSEDAIPTLVDSVDRLGEDDAATLARQLCARPDDSQAWYGFNLSDARTSRAIADLCDDPA